MTMRSLTCLLTLGACCATASAADVPLTVEEPAGVARAAEPVTSGVCFPAATYRPDQPFSLYDGDVALPLQTTPLVVAARGFLRWVLLDFQVEVGAGQAKHLVLKPSPSSAKPAEAIRTTDTPDTVTINTGPLALSVSKTKPFGLFESVQLHGKPVLAAAGTLEYVEGKTGARYVASAPRNITFEYSGPLRVTLRLDGAYEGPGDCRLRYITRITAWAGRTDVYVKHILANSNPERVFHANLRSAAITLKPTVAADAEALVGAGDVLRAPLGAGQSVWLHQGKVNRYYSSPIQDAGRAGVGEQVKWTGADPEGWIALRQGDSALLVCDRDFTGDPPRRLAISPDGEIRVEYISEKSTEGRGVPFRSDHCWLYDLSHKTAELLIDFATPADAGACSDRAKAMHGRLLAVAPPEHYSQCDVHSTGRFATLEDEKSCYEQWGCTRTSKCRVCRTSRACSCAGRTTTTSRRPTAPRGCC
jgi:hypothetical protein